jgi:ElaB/YqjD/DUF883 family membrane-anchored ribosome-binding protein
MEMDTRNPSMNPGSSIEEASGRVGAAANRVSARAHEAVDQVASAVHSAADRLSAQSENWLASKDEVLAQVRTYVREKPVMSLAIAAAIGFIVSRLTR